MPATLILWLYLSPEAVQPVAGSSYSTNAVIESGNFVQRIDNSYAFSAVSGASDTILIRQCAIDDIS